MFNDYLELIGNGYIEASLEEVFSGNEKIDYLCLRNKS